MRGRAYKLSAFARRLMALEVRLEGMETAAAQQEAAPMDEEGDEEDEEGGNPSATALEARLDAACTRLQRLVDVLASAGGAAVAPTALHALHAEAGALRTLSRECSALFVWEDGPLLTAMRRGELLLIDEISLAEDAVLERLNSVLDPARTVVLPEKGTELEEVWGAANGSNAGACCAADESLLPLPAPFAAVAHDDDDDDDAAMGPRSASDPSRATPPSRDGLFSAATPSAATPNQPPKFDE